MSNVRERSLIPRQWEDLSKWARPEEQSIQPETDRLKYGRRKKAVEMYADGESVEAIYAETKINEREMRRLVHRCVQAFDAEIIWGFLALVPGTRIKPYTRTTPVYHVEGGGSAGCAGALGYLFDLYEGLQDVVDDLIEEARTTDGIRQSRLNFVEIAKEFRRELLRLGAPVTGWPFNTADKGVEALRRYSKTILEDDADAYIAARHGKEAAQRGAVGKGRRPILPNVRPYAYVQMDFQKIDAASIIVLKHPVDGSEIEVPVMRWWIGVVAEQKLKVVLGLYIVLEVNPSAEAAIATVASAVIGPLERCIGSSSVEESGTRENRLYLPIQLMPDLRGMCFSAIKVDNAWCNDANPTVDQLVDYLGAAVNFGRVRGWWRRSIVERIFLELTQRGAQRLCSTYGSSPKDSKVDQPILQAIKHRILLSELEELVWKIVREYNALPNGGLLGAAPIAALASAMQNPSSGFLPQRLPEMEMSRPRIAYVRLRKRVGGNVAKHVRPYVEYLGIVWTNPALSQAYWLIGKQIDVYFNVHDSSDAFAVVAESGEALGDLSASGIWPEIRLPLQLVRVIYRWARKQRRRMDDSSTVSDFVAKKKRDALDRARAKRKLRRGSGEALDIARAHRAGIPDKPPMAPSVKRTAGNPFADTAFGLSDIPRKEKRP